VKAVADKIVESGGRAEAARVDAMNESEVNAVLRHNSKRTEK
jgi:hypothetical protein